MIPLADGIGYAGFSIPVLEGDKLVVSIIVSCDSHVGQYPKMMGRVFQNLINVISGERGGVARLMQISFLFPIIL